MMKMKAVLKGTIDGMTFTEHGDSGKTLMFGGYAVTTVINGKELRVPFDWVSCVATNQDDETILVEAGETTCFGGGPVLYDCYDKEYEKLGIKRSDLTAKVLAAAKSIDEFHVSCNFNTEPEFELVSMEFIDDTGIYRVGDNVPCSFIFKNYP